MRKWLITTLTCTSLIATVPTQSTAGDGPSLETVLGAAATLFILGKAIEHHRSKDRHKPRHKPKPVYTTPSFPDPRPPRVIPDHHRAAPLPDRCLRKVTGGNTRYVVGARCMERHYHSARPLPRACKMTVEAPRGLWSAYSVRCLRKKGYRLARN